MLLRDYSMPYINNITVWNNDKNNNHNKIIFTNNNQQTIE